MLRYWETEFPMLEPVKSPRGHRLYRQEDVDLVLKIKRLLYDEGFTIAGARRHLQELGADARPQGSSVEHHATASSEPAAVSHLNRKLLLDPARFAAQFLTLLETK